MNSATAAVAWLPLAFVPGTLLEYASDRTKPRFVRFIHTVHRRETAASLMHRQKLVNRTKPRFCTVYSYVSP